MNTGSTAVFLHFERSDRWEEKEETLLAMAGCLSAVILRLFHSSQIWRL